MKYKIKKNLSRKMDTLEAEEHLRKLKNRMTNKTSELELVKYDKDKCYYFINDNKIKSGYIIGSKINLTISADNTVLRREDVCSVQTKTDNGKSEWLEIPFEKLHEDISSLLGNKVVEKNNNKDMTFSEYQRIAMVKNYGKGEPIVYPALKLNGEAGEVAEKVGKVLRDKEGVFGLHESMEILKELSDVLWYISAVATDLGYSLEDVATTNIEKITKRRAENKISGSGDNR